MINVAITELLNWVNCKHIVTAVCFWWRRGIGKILLIPPGYPWVAREAV